MRRRLIGTFIKSGALFGSGQAPGTSPGSLPKMPTPAAPMPGATQAPKPATTPTTGLPPQAPAPAAPAPAPAPTTAPAAPASQPGGLVASHSQPSGQPRSWSAITSAIGMVPGANYLMPPQYEEAGKWYDELQNPNSTWMNSQKWDAAKNLRGWFDQNKGHYGVQMLRKVPEVEQGLNSLNTQMDSPMGQIGQYAAPALGHLTQTPEQFATFASMPVMRDIFKGVVGPAGIPGLALAHGFMSGNMGNWNALTAGLRDPSQRVAGRNFYNEVGQLWKKPGAARRVFGPDVIDRFLDRVRCAKYR